MALPLLPFAAAFHYGLIHSCHRWANYDVYDRGPLEYSYGAMDPAYMNQYITTLRNAGCRRHGGIFNAKGTYRHGRRQITPKTYDLNSEISYAINSARNS